MQKQIEYITKNAKHGDLKSCADAYKYDYGYVRQVATGHRQNPDMLQNIVDYIKALRAAEQSIKINA